MTRPAIASIVEGHSEVQSLPILLRRLLAELDEARFEVVPPWRLKRNRVVKPNELEKAVKQVVRQRDNVAAILVLLDADDDCPAKLGTSLRDRARAVADVPVEVVFAMREFEAWFLAAKESFRGYRGIRGDAVSPSDPESIRGAKEALSRNMVSGRRYLGTDDQPGFTACLDVEAARRSSASFAYLLTALQRLTQLAGE